MAHGAGDVTEALGEPKQRFGSTFSGETAVLNAYATPRPEASDAPDIVERAAAAYDRVKEWPEKRMKPDAIESLGEGFVDLLHLRNHVPTLLDALTALRAEVARLSNENGGLRHKAAVAQIGHDQLNRFIALFDGLGFKGPHVDEQARLVADELRNLRAEVARLNLLLGEKK